MSLFCNDVLLPSWGKLAVAEVLLVIWTQWSRKPSDREISVSVRERANGKRQQENEKRAAAPGLRLQTHARRLGGLCQMGSPQVCPISKSPTKALPACYSAQSRTRRPVLYTAWLLFLFYFFLFLSKESPPPIQVEVKWNQGHLGHTEVITLVTKFLSLWRVLMHSLNLECRNLSKCLTGRSKMGILKQNSWLFHLLASPQRLEANKS